MTFEWDAKNNFILLHCVALHQRESLATDIDWLSIVNDIRLEICSTPDLLKTQYENLLEIFYPKKDSKSLHSTLKHIYLHSLCQKIEDDIKLTLQTVYELIRHARAKRITANDIEQLLKEWIFSYSSDDQKINKQRLFDILNRLRDYIATLRNSDYRPIHYDLSALSNTNEPSTIQKEVREEVLELVSDSDEEMPTINKPNELINIDEQEKSSFTRRRTRSLTISTENKDNQVNIGAEWFAPKLKRQQRSSSLHTRSQSPLPIDSSSTQYQNLQPSGILMTTVDNDESSDSINDSNLRQTHTQPVISWLPLTNEQIHEKGRQQTELKFIDDQQLDPVSSSDSDSIEIQWIPSSDNNKSESSHDLHQHPQEHNPCKRQRLS